MNIIAFQIEDGTCRFIYSVSEGSSYNVVSVENYGGMIDFLKRSEGVMLSASDNIYEYANNLMYQCEKVCLEKKDSHLDWNEMKYDPNDDYESL